MLSPDVAGQAKVERTLELCLAREPKSTNEHLFDQNHDSEGLGLAYVASHSRPPELPLPTPAACLVFTCNGRGHEHHGDMSAETRALAAKLPDVPIAGAFMSGEFGPRFGFRTPRDVNQAAAPERTPDGFEVGSEFFRPENSRHEFSCSLALLGQRV